MLAGGLLLAFVAGLLTYIFMGELHYSIITNALLGIIAGALMEKSKA